MTDTPDAPELPPSLRLLKALVITLMITMIAGVIAMVVLLVTRLPTPAAAPYLPESLQMPDGTIVQAITMAQDWIAVITTDGRILFFTPEGRLMKEVAVDLSGDL